MKISIVINLVNYGMVLIMKYFIKTFLNSLSTIFDYVIYRYIQCAMYIFKMFYKSFLKSLLTILNYGMSNEFIWIVYNVHFTQFIKMNYIILVMVPCFYSCIKTSILEGVKKYSITLLLSNITLKEKTILDWDNTLLKK